MAETVELRVNGETHRLALDPSTPLLFVLRNDLGLRAAKLGCGLEQCGTCTVLVAGEASFSCRLPIGELAGREVVTLEGLGSDGELHPLQRAFIEETAAQCAFCVPGVIMAAAGLLAWNDDPSDAEIRRALAPQLCRCGAHVRMIRAVRSAAEELRE